VLTVKSVWQHYESTRDILGLFRVFRRMVNESIRIGLAYDASSLRKLSLLSYNQLAQYDSPSCYKLCAILPDSDRCGWLGLLQSPQRRPAESVFISLRFRGSEQHLLPVTESICSSELAQASPTWVRVLCSVSERSRRTSSIRVDPQDHAHN